MEKQVKKWLEKAEQVKKGTMDLSKDEDLSIALMNMISLEEHFYFTAMKTNNQKYLEMLNSIRELRKQLLRKIVKNPQGEEWCISKHLLATSMRLMEVGTKELTTNKKEANMYFENAFNMYALFFAINNKMISSDKIKLTQNKTILNKFSDSVKKLVDCCKE